MIKLIEFLKKRPGMSDEEFKAYYEGTHTKMVRHFKGLALDYRRNYPIHGYVASGLGLVKSATAPRPLYDCVTEVWFTDEEAFGRVLELLMSPKVKEEIEVDEDKFLDRSATKILICVEEVSKL